MKKPIKFRLSLLVFLFLLNGCDNNKTMKIDEKYKTLIGVWKTFDDSIGYTQVAYSVEMFFNTDKTGKIINTKYWNSKKSEVKVFTIKYELGKSFHLSNGDEVVEIDFKYESVEIYDGNKLVKTIPFNKNEGAFTIAHFVDKDTLYIPSRRSDEGDSEQNRIVSIDKKRSLIKYLRVK